MKQAIIICLIVLFCAGCGSNFEWFPKNGTFQNNSTAAPTTPPAATINKSLSFPTGVTSISDLVYDKNSSSFWLLAATIGTIPNAFIKMSTTTGLADPPIWKDLSVFTIGDGSVMTFDGNSFWITSNGFNGGKPVSEIYQYSSTGNLLKTYNCPATTTGFCQGLVWDATTSSFWAAGSDNKNLVNFQVANGAVTSEQPYLNLWNSNGVNDMGFDISTNQLVVLKDGMIPVNASNGSLGTKKSFILPGNGRGDWDGTYFWVIDNTAKKIKAVVVN